MHLIVLTNCKFLWYLSYQLSKKKSSLYSRCCVEPGNKRPEPSPRVNALATQLWRNVVATMASGWRHPGIKQNISRTDSDVLKHYVTGSVLPIFMSASTYLYNFSVLFQEWKLISESATSFPQDATTNFLSNTLSKQKLTMPERSNSSKIVTMQNRQTWWKLNTSDIYRKQQKKAIYNNYSDNETYGNGIVNIWKLIEHKHLHGCAARNKVLWFQNQFTQCTFSCTFSVRANVMEKFLPR